MVRFYRRLGDVAVRQNKRPVTRESTDWLYYGADQIEVKLSSPKALAELALSQPSCCCACFAPPVPPSTVPSISLELLPSPTLLLCWLNVECDERLCENSAELSNLAREVSNNFGSASDLSTEPNPSHSVISTVMSRKNLSIMKAKLSVLAYDYGGMSEEGFQYTIEGSYGY
ncbi:hypothetical protein SASPL_143248 [Salvia splendens]|uniref:Uncharacterized protein n=1 Tax=Salvia splendens TaxID=180675 RepID=A0A8X8WLU5_SALSN|nr:hypothetical protein SASPL_143248 [Salvia splendens]